MSSSNHQVVHSSGCPTVVLLHSSASSARQWKGVVAALQTRFRVHAVEFHGHGARTAWRGDAPLTLADEAALVAPLLAEAGGAHVVGHSYGAAVALKLATTHPEHVRSVVAYEPVLFRWLIDDTVHHRPAQDVVAIADAIRDRLAMNQKHSAAQRFIDFWSGGGSWESMPGGKQDFIATHMRAVLQHFDALFAEPFLARAAGSPRNADAVHDRRTHRWCRAPPRQAPSPRAPAHASRGAPGNGPHGTHHACGGGQSADRGVPARARSVSFGPRAIAGVGVRGTGGSPMPRAGSCGVERGASCAPPRAPHR